MRQGLWLTWELTKREVARRCRGTFLGIPWPVLHAGIFLAIFSFVFTVVLRVRWGQAGDGGGMLSSSLMIFCGMVPYLFVAEVMGRSPNVVLASANLVKRVRFTKKAVGTITGPVRNLLSNPKKP